MPPAPLFGPSIRVGRRVGMLSTYPPRLCGLATFAAALSAELAIAGDEVTVVAVGDDRQRLPTTAQHRLINGDHSSVERAVCVLSGCDVVIVQHEYGVYGGIDGDEVIELIRSIDVPVIVVLHTVLLTPTSHQRSVLESVAALAASVVVMTTAAAVRLIAGYSVDHTKVSVIPHGASMPATARGKPVANRDRPLHLLTWGLLGPGKGIEQVIKALALLKDVQPRIRYTVAGATHPNVFARDGDGYRQSLIALAQAIGVDDMVEFDDTYRDVDALVAFVLSASAVVLPYESRDQVTSGVLVDAIAAGRPVIATAFPHAIELLATGAGIVVAHDDVIALASAIRTLNQPAVLADMSARARRLAPTLAWRTVADHYRTICDRNTANQVVAAS